MTNQLTLLPSDKTFSDILEVVRSFPSTAPIVDIAQRIDLRVREESIFVAATGAGKTTLLTQLGIVNDPALPPVSTTAHCYGVLDDNGQHSDETLCRTMVAMLRHQRTQKYHSPNYKPIIMLRNSAWHRISNQFMWVPRERVGVFAFPQDAYATMLRTVGAPEWLIEGFLGPTWTSELCDARGHFLPKVAWDATVALASGTALTTSKHRAIATAGIKLWEESPTLQHFRQHMPTVVPDDISYRLQGAKLQISKQRLLSRLLSAREVAPLEKSRPQYVRALEAEGVVKLRPQGWYVFAGVHAAGLTNLKHRILLSKIKQ